MAVSAAVLPLSQTAVQDVLDVLHYQVDGHWRETKRFSLIDRKHFYREAEVPIFLSFSVELANQDVTQPLRPLPSEL